MTATDRKQVAIATGIALVLVAALFARHIAGFTVVPYDYEFYHFPLWKRTFDAFRELRWPHYDPYVYAGIPFAELAASMATYPPAMLFLAARAILPGDLTTYDCQFINLIHFAICYIGMVAWLRSRDTAPWLTHVLAVTATFAGIMIGNAQHAGVVACVAWVPWLLLATDAIVLRQSRRGAALAGCCLALIQLAGFQPTAIAINLAWAIYALALLVAAAPSGAVSSRGSMAKSLGLLVVAQVLHVLLSAPLWLPLLAVLKPTSSLGIAGPFHWSTALSLLAPNAINTFDLANYKAIGDPTATYLFTGPLLFLAFGALLQPSRSLRTATFLAAALCLALSLGLFAALIQRLPVVGVLHRPYLLTPVIVILLVGTMAGSGDRELRLGGLAGGAVFAVLALALVAAARGSAFFNVAHTIPIALLCVVVLAAIGLVRSADARRWIVVACAAATFAFHALVPNKIWMHPDARPNSYSYEHLEGGFKDLLATFRRVEQKEPFRIAVDHSSMGGPFNGGWRVFKIEAINGFEPTLETAYAAYLRDGAAKWSDHRLFGDFDPASPKLNELNVKYYIVRSAKDVVHPQWALRYDHHYRIYENLDFQPRFRLASTCSADDRVDVLKSGGGAHRLKVSTTCEGGAQLLMSERPHKGWQLRIDGQAAAWAPAGAAIGLTAQVPKGAHVVELAYRAPYLGAAFALAAAGVALLLLIMAPKGFPGRRSASAAA